VFYQIRNAGIFTGDLKKVKREHLEHIIRAAGAIAEVKEIIIIGSQAILGSFPNPPKELLVSMEADLYPPESKEKADLIDGSIGEESPFHDTFGYYAHGIGPETAILPENWKKRVVIICNKNTNSIKGICLHPIDIAVSKLIAARKKDINYVKVMLKNNMIKKKDLVNIKDELSDNYKSIISTFIKSI
jgi:hypothetical protein